MANKQILAQRMYRLYKEKTGIKEVDPKEVAKFALEHGWTPPKPISILDRVAKEFTQAMRVEMRYDKKTRKPYRANHAVEYKQGHFFWVDIDEAERHHMQKSLISRREQMVGDGYSLTLDADHWNGVNPGEQPINVPMDFREDIAERKAADFDKKKKIS
ncbi:MAG: hypothetical protein WC593_15755 [Methanoregula sp.]